jgi:hypothetical protein
MDEGYMEELLRSPEKGDRILPDPTVLERYQGPNEDAVAAGYRIAARTIIMSLRSAGDEVFLFYPVVFLYRHYVELLLKNLVAAFDEPGIRQMTQADELSEKERDRLLTAHSLQLLWDHLRPSVVALGNAVRAETVEGVNSYIRQLNEIDPDSTKFRYATELHATKARLKARHENEAETRDLRSFATAMERLSGYLLGLDAWVAEMNGYYYEMHAEADYGY